MLNISHILDRHFSSLALRESAVSIKTASSLGCAGASIAVFVSKGYLNKYLDPDGRTDYYLIGSESYIKKFYEAKNYLSNNSSLAKYIFEFIESNTTVKFLIINIHDWFSTEWGLLSGIKWSPIKGLEFANGGRMSPAMALMHEILHEYYALTHGLNELFDVSDEERQNAILKMEEYLIQNYESFIIEELRNNGFNEDLRTEYEGVDLYATSVTSTEKDKRYYGDD
jgi:hypothetical protein